MIINAVKFTLILLVHLAIALFSSSVSADDSDSSALYPTRIVALSPHAVEMLYHIGAGEQIIATIAHADYPDAATKLEVIGDHQGISLEKLIVLKPDLVITWSGGNRLNQIEQIKQMGFNVLDSNSKSLADIASNLRTLGRVTGHFELANTIADKFERDLQAITAQYQSRETVRVFYQLWSKPLMTISKASWLNQFIERCGGLNVFADAKTAYPQISVENILLSKAQVILIPDDARTRDHELFDWQRWNILPAVQNNHIYYPDARIMHRPSTRVLGPLIQVCEQIDKVRS